MCAAVVQMRATRGLAGNLETAEALVAQACAQGANLVVVPENFAYFGHKPLTELAATEKTAAEKTAAGPARALLARLAREHRIWLLGGTIPVAEPDDAKPYARSLLYSPEGVEVACYDKVHLFDVDVAETDVRYRESDDYRAGGNAVVADVAGVGLGLSVCYDLRFPELYRQLAGRGARILAAPSAFTATTGRAHWQLLLRARAVENLCFMLGANLVGRDDKKNPTWGGSAIIDPWGRVLAELDDEEGVAIADLDLREQDDIRRNMPVMDHRRIFAV
ncbi:MAG: carbon-nitrogen hydrolase family protein [Pseudomonas sp.]